MPECPLECDSTRFTYTYCSKSLWGEAYRNYINSNRSDSIDFDTRPVTATQTVQSVASVVWEFFLWDIGICDVRGDSAMDVRLIWAYMGNWGLYLGGFFNEEEKIKNNIYYKQTSN